MPRNAPRTEMPVESEEKEFTSFALFSPSRPPLNSIPDPSQLQKKATHLSGFELAQKFQGRGGGAHPRIVNRNARSRSEPNSSLVRELDEIQAGLGRYLKFDQIQSDFVASSTSGAEQAEEQKLLLSQQQDIEVVREQVETETARTILELQEEMIALESEFQGRFCKLTEENQSMKDSITARETEIRDWDKATLEPTNFIVDGSKSITDASTQTESVVCSFPQVKRKKPATKMTSRLPFFFFSVFLYTVTTLVSTASGATSCRTSCGSIQINYPFGIDKGCGSPQFNGMLNCSSSTDLFFFTPSGGYKVRSINYDKNTMVVFDPLMSTCSILQPHHDFKLSDVQNALIRPSYDTVFALFNCSSVSPVQNRYKSLCFNAAGHSCDELYSSCTSFRIFNTTSPYGNSTVHTTPYCCFTSYDTVRVMSMNILDCSHYTTVIDDGKMKGVAPIDWSYGIELSYSAPEIGCSPCQKSGGTCGYDDETEIFLCQCSNNISPRDCGGVSDRGGCNSTKANYPMLFLVMLVSFICAIL